MNSQALPLIAVDVGNTRIKFGLFTSVSSGLPSAERTFDLPSLEGNLESVADWLAPLRPDQCAWWIGSVNRPAMSRLLAWLRDRGRMPSVTLLAVGDLPLVVSLARPDMVGIDRLLNAVGANALRPVGTPAIVADLGTAITVDMISESGEFLGGAILPGISLAARGLHEFTDLLPLLDMAALADPPPALGGSTVEAMRSGLYWGAVGGIRELVARLSDGGPPPRVYLTGGAAPAVASLLSAATVYVPDLTLGGIALAAAEVGRDR